MCRVFHGTLHIVRCSIILFLFLKFKNTMKKKTIVKISIALLLILFATINKYTFFISAFIFGVALFFAGMFGEEGKTVKVLVQPFKMEYKDLFGNKKQSDFIIGLDEETGLRHLILM